MQPSALHIRSSIHRPLISAALDGLWIAFALAGVMGMHAARAEASTTTANIADAALAQVLARYSAETQRRNPLAQLQQGRVVDDIPAGSLEEAREDAATTQGHLDHLARIDRARLSESDRLSLDILHWSLTQRLLAERHWWYEFPVTPYTTSDLNQASQALAANPLASAEERNAYLSLLDAIGKRFETSRDRLQRQSARGIRFPAPAAGPAGQFLAAMQTRYAGMPAEVEQRTTALTPASRSAFVAAVRERIDTRVEPARIALVGTLEEAARNGPATVGLAQYPGGKAVYRDLVRFHTSLEVDTGDIHDYGEARIRRINEELEALARELRIPGGRAGIREWLRTDTRFIARSPDDVARRYRQAIARIVPRMPAYFSRQPAAPFGVRRLDPAAEGSMTFGYYQPPTAAEPTGEYRFNGSRLGERSLVFAAPLIYHELLPGHHFQIALQLENAALPPFRRHLTELSFNAYTEGWGEYSSALAGEMGLYDDPYVRLGRLMQDAFLSTRLVVDTGMNAYGWSLERARRYMALNTYQSETEIATESLRYATAIPGQALGYKMGHRVFEELRAAVQAQQGETFDIRAFHNAVLDGGAMPLSVLQAHVSRVFGLRLPGPVR
jgi:uncharacterized protein (DUF885 family)